MRSPIKVVKDVCDHFKSKAVWKHAHRILTYTHTLQDIKVLEKSIKEVDTFMRLYKDPKCVERYAYMLSEQNSFQGSPDFYWKHAQNHLQTHYVMCCYVKADLEQSIKTKRALSEICKDYINTKASYYKPDKLKVNDIIAAIIESNRTLPTNLYEIPSNK